MLASDLIPELRKVTANLFLSDLGSSEITLDITSLNSCQEAIDKFRPDWIVNCAAYTAVDKAEEEQAKAFEVNAIGPANLIQAIQGTSCNLLHVSSDYVFGGEKRDRPFSEEDSYAPCGMYGQSKRLGDEFLMRIAPSQVLIVRPSWLHGIHGPNFIDTMIRVSKTNDILRVVNDQIGSPTWTGWLSQVISKLMQKDARGIFHASSRGGISWYDFAAEIFKQAGIEIDLQTQTTEELGRPAPRPAYSTLDVTKLENFLGEEAISWRDCVSSHLGAR